MADDLQKKMADILNDPEAMRSIEALAGSLFSGNSSASPSDTDGEAEPNENSNKNENHSGANPQNLPDLGDLMRITNLLSSLPNDSDDAEFLMALRPHLGPSRQKRVDSAIRLLKLFRILPAVKASGLLTL